MEKGKVKFIRKNGRIIPIREKSGYSGGQNGSQIKYNGKNPQKEVDKQKRIADKKDSKVTKLVAGGAAAGAIGGALASFKKHTKTLTNVVPISSKINSVHIMKKTSVSKKAIAIGAFAGVIGAGLLARAKGLDSSKNREKEDHAKNAVADNVKRKAYAKMGKK